MSHPLTRPCIKERVSSSSYHEMYPPPHVMTCVLLLLIMSHPLTQPCTKEHAWAILWTMYTYVFMYNKCMMHQRVQKIHDAPKIAINTGRTKEACRAILLDYELSPGQHTRASQGCICLKPRLHHLHARMDTRMDTRIGAWTKKAILLHS